MGHAAGSDREPADATAEGRHAGSRADVTRGASSTTPDTEVSVLDLAEMLLRHRRVLVWLPIVCGAIAVAVTLLRGPRYEAEASFTPEGGGATISQLAGLAAQFGVNVGGGEQGTSVDFYAKLLKSRDLVEQAVTTDYHFPTDPSGRDSASGDLIKIWKIHERTPQRTLLAAVTNLENATTVNADGKAGIVTVHVQAKWPRLAEQITSQLLNLLNDFNLRKRQTQAGEERKFVEGRVTDVRGQLEAAEGDLERFQSQNRSIENSPRLQLKQAELQRRVDVVQELYVTLEQAYEKARMEEVRNTPVITIIEHPEGSAKSVRHRKLDVAVGILLGVALAVIVAFGGEYLRRERETHPEQYAEVAAQTRRLWFHLPRGRRR